jgi:hypothetical protein
MTVYPKTNVSTSKIAWENPIEQIWQILPGDAISMPIWKRPDIGVSDRLFIGAVMNTPQEKRDWGIVRWLGEVYQVSRPTLYSIGKRTKAGMLFGPSLSIELTEVKPGGRKRHAPKTVEVTRNRLKRMTLTLQFPGGVSGRSAEECLQVAFDEGRSPAYLSQLLHEAGKRAGEILEKVDHSGLGRARLARDELFVHHRDPILLMVEPHSLVITGLYATSDREAETWGCVILLTQDRKVQIWGLAEDNCIPYGASCKMARLDAAIQKDVWHPLEDVRKVIKDIDRDTWRKMEAAEKLEKRLKKGWVEADFSELAKLTLEIDDLLAQSDRLRFWLSCLWDAVELVDWRSGEIRNLEINQWLALESLKEMKKLTHPRIQKLVERLDGVIPEMLTFLGEIALPLAEWQAQALVHFQDPESVTYFQSRVARLWRMEHARRHDQKRFTKAVVEAGQIVADWIVDDPDTQHLAEKLMSLLEGVVRTSSAAETINSVLRPYLDRRRECTDLVSRQLFLNLFVLWFNMHKFDRGPRAGKSPYQLAGIDLRSDDWLTVLGYPPD